MAAQWKFPAIFVAATSLFHAPLGAAPQVMTQMGATSKASIEIRVSVAPRMGVSHIKEVRPSGTSARGDHALCVWSSASLRAYTVRLQPRPEGGRRTSAASDAVHRGMPARVASPPGLVNLAPGQAVDAVAHPSAAACGRIAGTNDLLFVQALPHGPSGPALLIFAPE